MNISAPLVSIVVATYNREKFLPGALASLAGQETEGQLDLEIVVVDNGSTDGTRDTVREFAATCRVPLQYVFESREGVAHARNAGIAAANGNWVAFFDDDQVAVNNWLRCLYSTANETGAKCVGGAVHLDLSEEELEDISPSYRETVLRESSRRNQEASVRPYRRNEYPGTGNLLLARSVFEDVGIFDEGMTRGGEDFDLSIRIRRAGYAMYFDPQAIIKHRVFSNRLAPAYMKWDAVQGGALTAYLDHKYRGAAIAVALCLARMVKSATLTIPYLLITKLSRNASAEFACQMRIRRLEGYTRGLLTALLPRVFPEEELTRRWAFRKGREIELGT